MAVTSREWKTCFPPVLGQYLPEQESTDDNVTSVDGTELLAEEEEVKEEKEEKEEEEEEEGELHEEEPVEHDRPRKSAKSVTLVTDESRPSVRHGRRSKAAGGTSPQGRKTPTTTTTTSSSSFHPHPPRRQHTSMSMASTGSGRRSEMKRREAERLEHVADVWDQARAEVLSERHAQLQEKVQLQHKLVRAQDLHALQLRQRREEQEALKRQEEKQKKQSKEAALQDICKQSLDEDRKRAASEQRRGRDSSGGGAASRRSGALSSLTAPSTPSSDGSSDPRAGGNHDGDSDSGGSGSGKEGRGAGGSGPRASHRHPGYRPSMGLPEQQLRSTPMRELEDEEEEEEEARGVRQGSEAQKGEVPSHHAQLYQLYGKQADYFLHPKQPAQTSSQQPQRRQTHPKLRNQKGHIGAGELWDTLRKDSKDKLLRNDSRFPQELKSAFSAFVRERLTKHVHPVERSFCATEDVPDIKRLMDQSKLRNTRLYRHKTELMYRSSVNNKDRTSILLHDNPMPDITETGQADSISRYLPSWMDTQSEMSEPEYMKWISAGKDQTYEEEEEEEEKENIRHSAHSRQLSETTNELHNIWHAIAARKKKPRTPRYQFLTEKEAESTGTFSQKFQEEKEQREKPQPHQVAKSYSAMEFSHPASSYSVPPSRERGRTAQSAMQLHRYTSDWEPLSMTALVEYKKRMDVEGEGEFDHGRVKMWPAATSSVA